MAILQRRISLDNNNNIIDLPTNNSISSSFKFKQQIREEIGNGGTRNVNFLRTLEILFINCEINLQLKWSAKCILVAGTAKSSTNMYNNRYKTLCSSHNFINSK